MSGSNGHGPAFDAIVVGAGHNGLTAAAYLAKAGLKTCVLERRHIVGGAAVTEEFHPGFRNSTASYTVSLLNPTVIRDLDLAGHGLRIVERQVANFLPLPDGRFFQSGPGLTKAERQSYAGPFRQHERKTQVLVCQTERPPAVVVAFQDVLQTHAGAGSNRRAAAEDFAKNDPYVTNGLVERWEVRKWNTVVGANAATPVR